MGTAVKEYWEQRASESRLNINATTNDVYLRELEIKTLIGQLCALGLKPGSRVLDVGCGDGWTTLRVAQAFPGVRFDGVDYSAHMIQNGLTRLAENGELERRVHFAVGDATRLAETQEHTAYDLVYSTRCLINLTSSEAQYDAVAQIACLLKSGGAYVAIENFTDGQDNLNATRREIGLPEIPVRWHNLFFDPEEFVARTRPHFATCDFCDFSSAYYYATRIVYSKFCQMRGEEPDYHHEIHRLAVELPWMGRFSPIRMVTLRKAERNGLD